MCQSKHMAAERVEKFRPSRPAMPDEPQNLIIADSAEDADFDWADEWELEG